MSEITTQNVTDGIDLDNPNRLETVFALQHRLQERLGTWDKIKDNPSMRQQFLNQMTLAMQEEVVEIMRETAYKNPDFVPFGWKKTQIGDSEKLKEELVDLLHFFVNFCLVAGLSVEELFKIYLRKNKVNHCRQDEGY